MSGFLLKQEKYRAGRAILPQGLPAQVRAVKRRPYVDPYRTSKAGTLARGLVADTAAGADRSSFSQNSKEPAADFP